MAGTPQPVSTAVELAPEMIQAPVEEEVVIDRLALAIELLQQGEAIRAQSELKEYLEAEPESAPARFLLSQIETPVPLLFPAQSFDVQLAKDQTLLQLAELYLGDPLGFYGLARYNGIAVPSRVEPGQTIHIPRTTKSLAAQKGRAQQVRVVPRPRPATLRAARGASEPATPAQPTLPTPAPTATVAERPASTSPGALAETYFREGLEAFQRHDLDGAIAAWDRTLALDPNHHMADLHRTQAVDLKNNLARVRGRATPVLATR
jgi:hypothetical protein